MAKANQNTGSTLVNQSITEVASDAPVPAEIFTIPLIIKNFDRNPDKGGTPANDSMNKNIEPATSGSLRANP